MARSHGRRVAVVLVAGLMAAAAPLGAALGADATGCSGSATSFDSTGAPIDQMSAPGARGTYDEPFVVDLDGTVSWQGSTPVALQDGSWSVTVGGFPVASGDMQNGEAATTKSGESEVSALPAVAKAPLEGQQKVPVVVDISTATGDCSSTIYVTTDQPPAFTPMWLTGLALMFLAFVLFWITIFGTRVVIHDLGTGQLAEEIPMSESVASHPGESWRQPITDPAPASEPDKGASS